ncbi:hypothetical protein [Actinoallomurus iriomotensis]|uniref:Uncharacterized protein n=1 Tax=Actinoallomurus iriomotensis TaxID=478107 RepID=A0A9W6SBC5_9ACTN|nr:hypothetical protein [Actinoallomurus iriomotensis]GLY89127.1 hypothetical protein Airi02_070560 [Actinoallomurus iriomotensis]
MAWIILSFIVALAVLGPLYGADTRDGRPSHFGPAWRRQNAR